MKQTNPWRTPKAQAIQRLVQKGASLTEALFYINETEFFNKDGSCHTLQEWVDNAIDNWKPEPTIKLRKDAKPFTNSNGFWYSLIEGGYLKPHKYIQSPEDLKRVVDAIETLKEFQTCMEIEDLIEEA